jgi:hypothetical protein
MRYLGVGKGADGGLPGWGERLKLLAAPGMPFEGMNECGLVVAVAQVPDVKRKAAGKERAHSLTGLRVVLDEAANVAEAVEVLGRYDIEFRPGPAVHMLIADVQGEAAVVEWTAEGMEVVPSGRDWAVATNYYLAGAEEGERRRCWRYARMWDRLAASEGRFTAEEAMGLLEEVSVGGTLWSVVYDVGERRVDVVLGREYGVVRGLGLR